MAADFSGAPPRGALIRPPHGVGSATFDKSSSPRFIGADLSGARIVARFDGADFRDVKLTGGDLSPYGDTTQNTLSQRSVMIACSFPGAVLRGADLSKAILHFASFEMAVLVDANLSGADLSHANLSGADLTGANLTNATLNGADLSAARGLGKATGLSKVRNANRAGPILVDPAERAAVVPDNNCFDRIAPVQEFEHRLPAAAMWI